MHTMAGAPQELTVLEQLRNPTEGELIRFLEAHIPRYYRWGLDTRSKPVSKFIEDVLIEKDTLISLISIYGAIFPLRDIQTVTLRITRPCPATDPHLKPTKKLLREYHVIDGVRSYRKHRNALSEKLTVEEWSKDHVVAVARALKQELQIDVNEMFLRPPHLIPVPIEYREQRPVSEFSFPECGFENDERYPGFQKRNQLHHFIFEMPDEYYHDRYHEPGKGYFEWASRYVDD